MDLSSNVAGTLTTKGDTDTEEDRQPRGSGGRDWSYNATAAERWGLPGAKEEETRKGPLL